MYQSQAQGLASLGRGDDSVLVHMTPGEVQGLQKLAMSAGGSLTINPQTGLPEAGFLSSMLPMIAAAAVTYFTGGAAAPYAGAIAGGLTGAVTNKENPLMGAIMGGMSGYSIGGVGDALSTMGTDAAKEAALKGLQNSEAGAMGEVINATAAPELSRQAAINSGIGQLGSEGGFKKFIGDAATKTSLATGLGGGMGAIKTALPIIAPIGLAAYQAMSNKNPFAPPAADPARFYKTTYNAPKFNPTTGRYDPASYGPGSTSSTAYMAEGGGVEAAANKMFAEENPEGDSPEDSQAARMSIAQLQRLAEMGTAPESAAAQKRLFAIARTQRAAPSDYTRHAAEGGLMGLAAGGDTRFAGTDGAFTPAADYYMNLLNTPQAAQPAQVSPNAMNDYLAKLNASFQYTPQATTPAPAAPPAPSTGGWTYDPVTKTYMPPVAPPAPVVNPYAPGVSTGEMGGGLSESPGYGGYQAAAGGAGQDMTGTGPTPAGYEGVSGLAEVGPPDVGPSGGGAFEGVDAGGIMASGGEVESNYNQGGLAGLQTYAAGGRLLRGPGDGMSDSIPAVIQGAKPQRAALADGEFVVPADVVSHLGNGSTEAGSKRLYSMMDKVRRARTGNPKQGKQINAAQFMPA